MKLAVLGDIHGNLEALKAAYAAATALKTDKICHLGDVGGYAPFVNEVVDFLIDHDIEGVQGNYDEAVANGREHCGCRYEDAVQAEMAQQSFDWTKQHASLKSKTFMKRLPESLVIPMDQQRLKLFHATPHKNNLYWYEDRPDRFFREMAEKADAEILVFGHTHKSYKKEYDNIVFINAGSVGKPKDGDPRACVTMIDSGTGNVAVEFLRVPYDVERTAAAIVASGLPSYFAERLRQGK